MQAVEQRLAKEQLSVDQDCHAARAALQAATARLQLELGSAGNIWLEEGRPSDAWVQSCQELVHSSSCGPQVGQASSAPREELKVWCTVVGGWDDRPNSIHNKRQPERWGHIPHLRGVDW
jgi:hypothetical protein